MAQDKFANIMSIEVTESAQGVLTFNEALTGAGFGTGRGMMIDQIDYFIPQATLALLTAGGDFMNMGITLSNGVTDLEDFTGDNRIIHSMSINTRAIGTAASGFYVQQPFSHQFFPPIIHGQPKLFAGVVSASISSAATIRIRIFWRYADLTNETILEIAETFAVV